MSVLILNVTMRSRGEFVNTYQELQRADLLGRIAFRKYQLKHIDDRVAGTQPTQEERASCEERLEELERNLEALKD